MRIPLTERRPSTCHQFRNLTPTKTKESQKQVDTRGRTIDRGGCYHNKCNTPTDRSMTIIAADSRSNKFVWNDYTVPRWPLDDDDDDDAKADDAVISDASFTLRHLKQGATGAVKTWPVAELLLDYLVRHGGLLRHKSTLGALDLTHDEPADLKQLFSLAQQQQHCQYNILELGAGTGYVGIGLARSLQRHSIRVLCTDNDKNTLKNMRHNLRACQSDKTVRVAHLDWGDTSILEPKFVKALETFFPSTGTTQDDPSLPLERITHVIGSDVHYGETTLEPLSTVIAAVKLQNPKVQVTLLIKERAVDSIGALKNRIQDKVGDSLPGFSVLVRDVLHESVTTVKIIEC
ncbi:expressed unknown protein [Seminavis robusta]|uniref:Uncharacterized protein n=1 Tax=Seminavis robusta TaxID=568900 RepID=A0A9N8H7F5_9STRA|nr:expressed unknown protein [Seminavis robusta]|eukprot:Sro202_g085430.1 n/a (347) ;mRNA; r:49674-50714